MLLAVKMLAKVEKYLRLSAALKSPTQWQLRTERRLANGLRSLYSGVFDNIVNELLSRNDMPSSDMARRQLMNAIFELMSEHQQLVSEQAIDAATHGRNAIIAELQRQGTRGLSFSGFSNHTRELITQAAFESSDIFLNRMAGEVMENLAQSYEQGLGIGDAAERLREKFSSISDSDFTRIARTEINAHQNMGAEMTELELGIEYHMWWTAEDERVRDEPEASHVEMHGQIVRVGERFSNGLEYPGDHSGPIAQWINCRCRIVPFLVPEGMRPPIGRQWFTEGDLVPING